ncbi:MAG: hypothetical protein ACOYOU_01025 [Kiritimatiellia bacterium]
MNVADYIPSTWIDMISPDHPVLGMGLDVATTTGKKSNPSALALTQSMPPIYAVRLLISWKSTDPAVAEAIVRYVIGRIPYGLRVKALHIDATSERYFAVDLKRKVAPIVTVRLINSSKTTVYKGEQMSTKSYLGNLMVNTIEDGFLWVPNEPWVKTDLRLVNRDRGTFDAEVNPEGRHGDCFDGIKLSIDAIVSKGGPVVAAGVPVGNYAAQGKPRDRFPLRAEDYIRNDHKRGVLV